MSLKAVMDYGYGLERDILKLRNYTITEKKSLDHRFKCTL